MNAVEVVCRREGGAAEPALGHRAGEVLRLIREGSARSRSELVRQTGLARSTVSQRVEALIAHRLVLESRGTESTGGRPPLVLSFNRLAGVVLAADLGRSPARLAVMDLAGGPLAEAEVDVGRDRCAEPALERVDRGFQELLDEAARGSGDVRGVALGLDGPVDRATGRALASPRDGLAIPSWFGGRYPGPILVDDAVNLMARAEYGRHWRHVDHMLFVHLGDSIGCGIIVSGRVLRGEHGAAGDIGHIGVSGSEDICPCGNTGCLTAVAGGRAIARRLATQGADVADARDVARLVRAGDSAAARAVRDAGRRIGEVLAAVVELCDPSVIVFGGDLLEAREQLLAGVREMTFRRTQPLISQELCTACSQVGDRATVVGAALMVIEHVLAPGAIDRLLRATAR